MRSTLSISLSKKQSHSLVILLVWVGCCFSISSPGYSQPQDRDGNGTINFQDLILLLKSFQPGLAMRNELLSYSSGWNSSPNTPFDIKDYFVKTAGSNWHYTGMNGASTEDDFRWTVEVTQQNVGGGKMAKRVRTDTDEPTDARTGDVDFWLVESDGKLFYYGLHLAKSHSISGLATIPSQDIVFSDPVEVGHNGLKIGDKVTDTGSGSAQITTFLGPQTITGTAKSSFEYTDRLPAFVTPLGTFTDVIRIVINLEMEFTITGVPFPLTYELKNNTFFMKKGVGLVAQDQQPDDNDAEIQGIDEGTVFVGEIPISVVAN